MVEHELDRTVRSRLESTLKGPCATEIQAHNREIGEPCLRDGRGSALAKNPSTSPQMPGSSVLMEMPLVPWKNNCGNDEK